MKKAMLGCALFTGMLFALLSTNTVEAANYDDLSYQEMKEIVLNDPNPDIEQQIDQNGENIVTISVQKEIPTLINRSLSPDQTSGTIQEITISLGNITEKEFVQSKMTRGNGDNSIRKAVDYGGVTTKLSWTSKKIGTTEVYGITNLSYYAASAPGCSVSGGGYGYEQSGTTAKNGFKRFNSQITRYSPQTGKWINLNINRSADSEKVASSYATILGYVEVSFAKGGKYQKARATAVLFQVY